MPALVEKPEYAYRMERMRSVDIDEEEDFLFAETLLKK
jgi:CMP-N-acetylneuraminic acid synthetase